MSVRRAIIALVIGVIAAASSLASAKPHTTKWCYEMGVEVGGVTVIDPGSLCVPLPFKASQSPQG